MTRRLISVAAGAAAALICLTSLRAVADPGSPQQRPIFRTGVELVEVDVVVLDEDGRPVRGLTADDFTILDRREPRTIATFSEVAHVWDEDPDEPAPPRDVRLDVADNTSVQSARVVLLVLDDLSLWVDRVDDVKRMAHRVIDGLGPQASMAVLFSSGRESVEVTTDRALLHAAIDSLEGQFHRFRTGTCWSGEASECGCTPRNPENCHILQTIEDAARMIGAEDQRRKAIVVLSEGHHVDIRGLFEAGAPRYEMAAGQTAIGVREPFHEIALLDMMRELHRANATYYAVDPRGRLQTPEERSRESRGENNMFRMLDPQYWSQEGLIETAEASGGFAIVDTNDFDAGLDRIVADLDNYYLLGFHPEDPDDRGWHDLQVTVNRPGVTIRHRKGYRLGAEPEAPENEDPLVQLSAGVLPRTGLPLRLFAAPAARDGDDSRVAVAAEVRVPGAALARPGGRLEDTLTLTAVVADLDRHRVVATARHQVDVAIAPSRVRPDGDVTYQLVFGLDLAPGAYQLRVSAESARTDESGSVYLMLDVPDVADAGIAIAGPTVGFAPGGRPAAGATLVEDGLLPRGLDPVLDRVFTPADTLRVHYRVWRRDGRGEAPTRLQVLDDAGHVVFARDGIVPDRGTGPFDVEIPLAGLPPGPYRVKISAGTGDTMTEREVGFAVRSGR
jgi:VWFA-related protein